MSGEKRVREEADRGEEEPPAKLRPPAEARFVVKSRDVGVQTPCRIWLFATNPPGYDDAARLKQQGDHVGALELVHCALSMLASSRSLQRGALQALKIAILNDQKKYELVEEAVRAVDAERALDKERDCCLWMIYTNYSWSLLCQERWREGAERAKKGLKYLKRTRNRVVEETYWEDNLVSNIVACEARIPGREVKALVLVMGGRKRWPKGTSLRREFEETYHFILSHTNAVHLFLSQMTKEEDKPSGEQAPAQSSTEQHPSHRRCCIM